MKLTIARRIRYAWNVLTYREKHGHGAQVKALDLFMEGYDAGMKDGKQQPTPDVSALVEALEQIIKAAPSGGPLWHGSEQIVEARAALATYRKGDQP